MSTIIIIIVVLVLTHDEGTSSIQIQNRKVDKLRSLTKTRDPKNILFNIVVYKTCKI